MENLSFNVNNIPSPCYVIDERSLRKILQILKEVADTSGCKILLAQKAFSNYCTYPIIAEYLAGTTSSGLFEAKLSHEYMGKENHVFSAGYTQDEIDEILTIADTIIFNSIHQWEKFKDKAIASGKKIGIRINPECSTQETAIYDPCSPYSRLGVTAKELQGADLTGVSGLHFHALCEQDADALKTVLEAVEIKFAPYLKQMSWINMGGGHHITKPGYNIKLLTDTIVNFKQKYPVEVYLEPGEAVALNAGFLVASVLDIVQNEKKTAILDVSATCHMPDVLEMPYRPNIIGADIAEKETYSYIVAGPTCLAGDVIGEYSFAKPLQEGDKIVFADMAIYTMVKTNMFNGINLPSIILADTEGRTKLIRKFGYADFTSRL